MAIFHFKHSYLNWRVFFLDCCLGLIEFFSSAWHDNQFSFFFFSFFFHFFCNFSTPGNDTCHRWSSELKHLFPVWGLFWKVSLLVQGCLGHFRPKRGSWLKSISEKWVILVNMSQDIKSKVISRYRGLGILFYSWKRFDRFETASKSWCIPNYQMSVFQKLVIFIAWFLKNSRKRFLNQEFHGQLPEKAWSHGLFDFPKSCPLGHHPFFFIQMIP